LDLPEINPTDTVKESQKAPSVKGVSGKTGPKRMLQAGPPVTKPVSKQKKVVNPNNEGATDRNIEALCPHDAPVGLTAEDSLTRLELAKIDLDKVGELVDKALNMPEPQTLGAGDKQWKAKHEKVGNLCKKIIMIQTIDQFTHDKKCNLIQIIYDNFFNEQYIDPKYDECLKQEKCIN
jgi:hypothetical protein